jgi:hypothetical protein
MNRPSRKAIAFAISAGLSVAASVGIALHRTALTNQIGNALANLAPMQTARANPANIVAQAASDKQQFELIGVSNGIAYGTASLSDSAKGGVIQYSVARVGATGYLYGSYKDDRFTEADFANLIASSPCQSGKAGYSGFKSLSEIKDVKSLKFATTKSILLGDRNSGCYAGLLVFRQAVKAKPGQFVYFVLEPVKVDGTTLNIRWWSNLDPKATDFSKAPETF